MIYNVTVQAVILYGSEIWVVTDMMMTVLEVFHQRTTRKIVRTTVRKGDDGEWEWASVDAALEVTGIWPMRKYMNRRYATITEYVSGRLMYRLWTGEERMEGSSRFLRWWDQEHDPKQAEREVG